MGEIVDLKPANLTDNLSFISDLCRFSEKILTEAQVRKKYHLFTDEVWEKLGSDDALIEKVEEEKVRRIRTGQGKREKAQLLVMAAPDVASKILLDDSQNARHRLDSAKILNDLAANPADSAPTTSDRFIITINLGGDHIERFDKSIAINADDAPNGKSAPQRSLPAANKWDDGDEIVAAPSERFAKKTSERKAGRLVERKSPEELALESLLAMDE